MKSQINCSLTQTKQKQQILEQHNILKNVCNEITLFPLVWMYSFFKGCLKENALLQYESFLSSRSKQDKLEKYPKFTSQGWL